MKWGSLSEFLAMGGYGLYVWGSYLVTAACIAAEVILLRARRRTLMERLSLTAMNASAEEKDETQA
ncbi:MAG TPA: heme exporter protein CcmD [Burkholderiales bacterium]|nr:heme exporter protein CcmD [Burkholderiales bacterium]